jgi:hypothetical protein
MLAALAMVASTPPYLTPRNAPRPNPTMSKCFLTAQAVLIKAISRLRTWDFDYVHCEAEVQQQRHLERWYEDGRGASACFSI